MASTTKSAMRRRRKKADRRGVALILVLGSIVVLTVFLTELLDETSADLAASVAERDALRAEYLARSGVNLSRMLIALGPKVETAVLPMIMLMTGGKVTKIQIPVWNFTDQVLGVFNDPTYAGTVFGGMGVDPATAKNLGLSGGHFELTIVDEDAKINLNGASGGSPIDDDREGALLTGLLVGQQYDQLFQGRDADNQFSDRQTICSALVDWVDPDESAYACDLRAQGPSNSGGEDNIYQSIGLPYRRKNAAFDSLEEARMVRGVGDEFWSTFVDPDPSDPKKRVMTVWSQGQVNVNSANAQTLLALICAPNVLEDTANDVCKDPIQAESFLTAVAMIKATTMGFPLFASPKDFVAALEGGQGSGTKTASSGTSPAPASAPAAGAGSGSPFDASAIFSLFQLKPVKFKNRNLFSSTITVRSHMFSIYAEGIVPGYKRKTRVKIHAVVDFRHAQTIGEAQQQILGGATNGQKPAAPGSPAGGTNNQSPSQATPDAIMAMTVSSPAGNVVYWRVE